MDWLDYREKLGIGFADHEKVKYFIVKMFNVLDEIYNEMAGEFDESEYFNFCNVTGTPRRNTIYGNSFGYVVDILRQNSQTIEAFLSYYIAFINCKKDTEVRKWKRAHFQNLVCNLLKESHIPYEVLTDKDGFFVFPKGAKELDDALVSEPLKWLSAYPKAHAAFVKALKEYANATPDNASDIADKFRKALETFFQEFFECDKSLENCKNLYGGYLKSHSVPSEIAGNMETLLQSYTHFMNGYAKHHDKTSINVLEYIMYQTGNLIRLLITLKRTELAEQ